MTTDIRFVDVFCQSELTAYRSRILQLFNESFDRDLDGAVWDWAYIDNPFGAPVVSLAFDKDKLVGHYAVVPFFMDVDDEVFKSYLSMTTMVGGAYRKLGLFVKLAERVYSCTSGELGGDFVFGFPNQMSAPGFRKRLSWSINENYYVTEIDSKDLPNLIDYLVSSREACDINISGDGVESWRARKPGTIWMRSGDLFTKEHEGCLDVMSYKNPSDLLNIGKCESFTILLPGTKAELLNKGFKPLFEYPLGYRKLSERNVPVFNPQMSFSDVF